MKRAARFLLPLLAASGLATASVAAERTIIVLDASGSMWGQIDGKPKLEIARETLRNVLKTVPADTELGLLAYGHREKGSCTDIQLIVPPAKGTEAAISSAVDNMKFLGKTPLSAAVKQAAEDLRYTEEKSTVILITDGLETCSADPCSLGKELEQSGVDFTAHVVGFGLTADEGKKVACLAENTGGKYIQASDAKGLEDALKTTVVAAPEPAPAPPPAPSPAKIEYNFIPTSFLSEGGPKPKSDIYYEVFKVDGAGGKGDRVDSGYEPYKASLPAGDYIIDVSSGYAKAQQKVTVTDDKLSEPKFNLNAGELTLRARPTKDGEVDRNAQIIVDYVGDGESTANFGQATVVVPAGDTPVTVKLGAGAVTESLQVAAGQVIDKDIIVGVGQITANAFYTAGGEKVDSGDLSWEVFKAAKKLDGSREKVSYEFGPGKIFQLPAGDYVMALDMQDAQVEAPFSVAVGEAKDLNVVLNAGVLAIDAPGADGYEIFEGKKNLQGERKKVGYGFGEKLQTTLVAGDYVVITDFKTDKAYSETPFTIRGGERTELKIE